VTAGTAVRWSIIPADDRLRMTFAVQGDSAVCVDGLELVFPFDPGVTPTTVLPSEWVNDGSLRLPAMISAPDFGQMMLLETGGRRLKAHLEGSRVEKLVNFIVELPALKAGETCALSLTPTRLAAPEGLADQALWAVARRGWVGAFQPSAQWADQHQAISAPAGVLANNVVSDPASVSLWFYADQALWTPELERGISVMALVRRSVDWWLERTRSNGEVIGYWDYGNFLDANAGVLIAAWDYVEATGDQPWLTARIARPARFGGERHEKFTERIERLEFIADFLAKRDVDGDGLVEALQSGNRGLLKDPGRSCGWFDALNAGHKDGYANALIYRAWRCLADLEGRLGRLEKQARYRELADRLKAAYAKTLYNPLTGWLAWWKSEDGELHDYATPLVNGLAIEYGLVEPAQGREILARLWKKIASVGFQRLDLGVPAMLVPVRRCDYLQPALGAPQREDGADTLGHYQNGGIHSGQALHFLAAHYVVGQPEQADQVLRAMLQRQAAGKFQNGVCNVGGQGAEWADWQGQPSGYEGYLADNYIFLQAVLLREAPFRARFYRPLAPKAMSGAQR
jgi:hypothetical protein